MHVFIFGVYFVLQGRGFLLQTRFPYLQKRAILITFIISLSLGAATELIQQYIVPMRDGNIYDFIADSVGCILGWGLLSFFFRTKKIA